MRQAVVQITDDFFHGSFSAFYLDKTEEVSIDMGECVNHFRALAVMVVITHEVVLEV